MGARLMTERKAAGGSPLRHNSHVGDPQPSDGEENWSREKLLRMDWQFCERVGRAIAAGDESLDGAIGVASGR
jgi:hypothetical protein